MSLNARAVLAASIAFGLSGSARAADPPRNGAGPAPASPVATAGSPSPAPTARGGEALRLFGRLEDDRALVYVGSGPPDARKVVSCPDAFREVEVWTYLEHSTLGPRAQMVFFPESGTNVYRYWTVLDGEDVLLSPARAGKKPLDEVAAEVSASCPDAALVTTAFHAVTARQKDNNGGLAERSTLAVPHVIAPPNGGVTEAAKPVLVSNKPLGGGERKKLTQSLPEKYRVFLEDVEPILTDVERDTFLKLTTDYQRERFLEGFWKRRSVGPDGMRIAFKDIYLLRLQQVKERYRNINTDQGRIFLVNGPPDALRRVDCQDIYWPIELWYYERLESLRLSKVALLFYKPFGAGDFKLWTPLDGGQAIIVGGMAGMAASSAMSRRVDITRCMEWQEVQASLNVMQAVFGSATALKMMYEIREGPKPDVEGVDSVLLMTTDLDRGAATLPIQRILRFPEMVANKMRMELVVVLERDSLSQKKMGDETFFDIDLVGEVVKGERLVDNFRYRFDFPASTVNGAFVPLTIERELYPGDYQIKVKVADANRNAGAVLAEKLKVPEVPDAALTAEEKSAREAARAAVTKLAENPNAPTGSLTFVPLALEIATGLVKFETRASSADVAWAEFYLDDHRIMTKRRAPFDVDLDLGMLPRKHTVKVIGYTKEGRAIAEDQMILNEGREAFRVRIASPDKGAPLQGATRVVADVAVPETKRLKAVEFFVNDTRVATLFQPPFQQVVDVPKSKDLGFLRVVATLEDGTATEDLRYFNAPKYLSEVDVRAVELYTSVFQHGKPVAGLTKDNFHILEDGVPQTLDAFEIVQNLPLALGIGMDTSGSMEESIVEAQKAATEFLKDVMTPKDRCFLVTFDNEPQLVSRFTTDRDRLAQAMAGLRAQGSTALWDAIVYGLYQFQGIRGRKAYVVLTDGEDRNSKFTFDAALDYAKKSGAAIYFIGLKIGATQLDVRYKLNRMAKETGGTVYHVDSARNLGKIYKEIDEELRSQYLISYVPQNKSAGGAWRKVEVKMTPDNLTARTISGYYP